jgi:hypothetical protein
MPRCLPVCLRLWKRAARSDGLNHYLNYFASPVGRAEHCLSATKLMLPPRWEVLVGLADLSA